MEGLGRGNKHARGNDLRGKRQWRAAWQREHYQSRRRRGVDGDNSLGLEETLDIDLTTNV